MRFNALEVRLIVFVIMCIVSSDETKQMDLFGVCVGDIHMFFFIIFKILTEFKLGFLHKFQLQSNAFDFTLHLFASLAFFKALLWLLSNFLSTARHNPLNGTYPVQPCQKTQLFVTDGRSLSVEMTLTFGH